LEHFIAYYQSLGVTHFIMIDNLSEDEGPEYLKSLKHINLRLYRTECSYRDAAYGTKWINQILKKYCVDHYCFTVDIDELFLFDSRKYQTLHDLIDDMESSGSNTVPVTLLDMYPKRTNDSYRRGKEFLSHSQYFDDLNETFYEERGEVYETFAFKVGGVRRRVLGAKVCINKFPFFKYDFHPLEVAPGYHFFKVNGKVQLQSDKISLFQQAGVLLHFKFLKPHLEDFFKTRVNESQCEDVVSDGARHAARSWADENQQYAQLFAHQGSVDFFDHHYSRLLKDVGDLSSFFSINRKLFPP